MTARSYSRGWQIEFVNEWIWSDTKEPIIKLRVCKKCGCFPTKEGYDACIGHVKGVTSACCGHGIKKGYKRWKK